VVITVSVQATIYISVGGCRWQCNNDKCVRDTMVSVCTSQWVCACVSFLLLSFKLSSGCLFSPHHVNQGDVQKVTSPRAPHCWRRCLSGDTEVAGTVPPQSTSTSIDVLPPNRSVKSPGLMDIDKRVFSSIIDWQPKLLINNLSMRSVIDDNW
jgi:hypothetical protein